MQIAVTLGWKAVIFIQIGLKHGMFMFDQMKMNAPCALAALIHFWHSH